MFSMKRYDPLAPDAGSTAIDKTTSRKGDRHGKKDSSSGGRTHSRHHHHRKNGENNDDGDDGTMKRKIRSNRNIDDKNKKNKKNKKEEEERVTRMDERKNMGVDGTDGMDCSNIVTEKTPLTSNDDKFTITATTTTDSDTTAVTTNSGVVTPTRKSRWGPRIAFTTALTPPQTQTTPQTLTQTQPVTKKKDGNHRHDNATNVNDDSSSSAPSSSDEDCDDDSSSSAPSSSSDEEESKNNTKEDAAMASKHTVDAHDGPNDQEHIPSTDSITTDKTIHTPPSSSIPLLKIIAPEQKPSLAGTKPSQWTDEGMDDFDHPPNPTNTNTNTNEPPTPQTEEQIQQSLELNTALQVSRLPLLTAAKLWNLSPFLTANLIADGHTNFFPIQALVIPDVISGERYRGDQVRSRDVCVSAPTGSGKTLSFVLPILNSLGGRRVRRLRALVVLPGRDLAMQVHSVFQRYSKGSDLTIGLAIGQTDFKKEQRSLILGSRYIVDDHEEPSTETTVSEPDSNDNTSNDNKDEDDNDNDDTASKYRMSLDDDESNTAMLQYTLDPMNAYKALRALCPPARGITEIQRHLGIDTSTTGSGNDIGGRSAVDVLVCTPGRLMDHLDRTPGFTLQHLRFLVLDEADRLVSQRYQNWIKRVQYAAMEGPRSIRRVSNSSAAGDITTSGGEGHGYGIMGPVTWRREHDNDTTTTETNSGTTSNVITAGSEDIDPTVCHPVQLRKWLFSATLTQDPQKLASLGLINPKRYDAHHLLLRPSLSGNDGDGAIAGGVLPPPGGGFYSLPEGLSEFQIECRTAEQKLPVLLALLLDREERSRLKQRQNDPDDDNDNDDDDGIVVVFTSSIDSTHRLTRLLQLLWCGRRRQQRGSGACGPASSICEFSSALSQDQRVELVRRCRRGDDNTRATHHDDSDDGRIRIVVCSDGMSRGMDLPSVTTVINYDVPSHAKTYVHRCGRTARAGRKGRAITIMKVGQVGMFEKMHRLVEGGSGSGGGVREMGVRKEMVRVVLPLYKKCVVVLRKVMEMEEDGDICSMTSLDEEEWGLALGVGDGET